MGDLIRRAAVIRAVRQDMQKELLAGMPKHEAVAYSLATARALHVIRECPDAEAFVGWIPFTTRPMVKEELEEYAEYFGCNVDAIDPADAFVYTCELPKDGQEVLITNIYGDIVIDKCERDDFFGFEANGDTDGYLAWMPLPEPYRKEASRG